MNYVRSMPALATPPRRFDDIEIAGSDTSAPLTLKKRVDLVDRWAGLAGKRVLDAGCGAGRYVEAMAARGAEVHGVEYLTEKVREWQSRHPGDERVRQGDLEKIDFPDATFDVVLLNEVLEHVPNDRAALRELARVLKPGGWLMLFSPNRYHPFETHGVYSRATGAHLGVARTFLVPWIPLSLGNRWWRYWARNYWPSELGALTRASGFAIERQTYVWQMFENISGHRPPMLTRLAGMLRRVSAVAEWVPVVRRLGVSQLIVARRLPG